MEQAMSPEENPTWREVHTLVEAKVIEIRREQDLRYRDVDAKLDRNADNVNRLERTLEVEMRKIRDLLGEAKDELAVSKGADRYKQFIFPVLISVLVAIIEAIHLFQK
jgi:hypothetical protein